MKKGKPTKGKAETSDRSRSSTTSGGQNKQGDEDLFPLDILTVKIMSLRLPDNDSRHYVIKVTFFDQIIMCNVIQPIFARSKEKEYVIAQGTFNYDPSDYEKMCLFADSPLNVMAQPLQGTFLTGPYNSPEVLSPVIPSHAVSDVEHSSCNIDILPLFTSTDQMCVKKRMEPVASRSTLQTQSWDNLPLITMKLSVERHEQNGTHHELLRNANSMKITVVGAYNLMFPFRHDLMYSTATVLPIYNELNTTLMVYNKGHRASRRFDCTQFYPKWESLRHGDDLFTNGDEKLSWKIEDIQNNSQIDLQRYLHRSRNLHTASWASFHRTLVLGRKQSQRWLWKQLRRWHWPLELHLTCEGAVGYGYSWMAFLDLFKLLYPGSRRIFMAVPLHWHSSITMLEHSNCRPLLMCNEPPPSTTVTVQVGKKLGKKGADTTRSSPISVTSTGAVRPTGADENAAFVIVEVVMGHPLVREHIPQHIPGREMMEMLEAMEQGHMKRQCTGRGQADRDWRATARYAAEALRRVPHHGLTELCIFNRQLSETRTRVELLNSFWMDSAVYVNNNFVVQHYVDDDNKFKEMLMMAHANLVRMACDTLVGRDSWDHAEPTLRAARQARHLQDTMHAMELYMQDAAAGPHNENVWRELATCLRDVDRDWAAVCIDKAFLLDTKHPLSLISKACMVFEEDPDAAEIFFRALIYLYPFWGTAWVIASAYYHSRELFKMADQVMDCYRLTLEEHLEQNPPLPRTWDNELGDWWDPPPLLPGMSPFYDAADLLLRLRGISLAEVCIAIAFNTEGESAVYYHMVGLCCRLRHQIEDALCNVRRGITTYGEVNYLKSLEGECLHLLDDPTGAMAAFDKAGANQGPYSTLLSLPRWEPPRVRSVLVDLLRRQPSAYAWLALANDWMTRAEPGAEATAAAAAGGTGPSDEQTAARTCAAACAVQALKLDRRAGRAWALLATLGKPNAARVHCFQMAASCGYPWVEAVRKRSRESLCYRLGRTLKECHCALCDTLKA